MTGTLRSHACRSRLRTMNARGVDARNPRNGRSFVNDGERWTVSERDASGVPGAHAATCLIFESQGVVRRAWSFPPNWRDMDDGALWRLSELAVGSSPLIDALKTAFIASIVAQRSASTVIATARVVLEENRALRSELRTRLQQCREARRVSRETVASYAREQRAAGQSAVDVLKSLDVPLQQTAFVVSDPSRAERLASDVARWCSEEFRAA